LLYIPYQNFYLSDQISFPTCIILEIKKKYGIEYLTWYFPTHWINIEGDNSMKSSSIKLQIAYGVCAIAGIVFTLYFNILFIIEHGGFSAITFVAENYINNASASITNDILVVVVTFLVWSFIEARRLSMPYWWVYAVLTFCIAIAFTFPLFLLNRERRIAEIANTNG